jgi:phosphoribosylformylglycinamidine cyclo-ligase
MKNVSGLDDAGMLTTFNCGIGMVLIVDKSCASEAKTMLLEAGEDTVFDLGTVVDYPEIKMINPLTCS